MVTAVCLTSPVRCLGGNSDNFPIYHAKGYHAHSDHAQPHHHSMTSPGLSHPSYVPAWCTAAGFVYLEVPFSLTGCHALVVPFYQDVQSYSNRVERLVVWRIQMFSAREGWRHKCLLFSVTFESGFVCDLIFPEQATAVEIRSSSSRRTSFYFKVRLQRNDSMHEQKIRTRNRPCLPSIL